MFAIDGETLKAICLHDKHLREEACKKLQWGGNLSCPNSGGRSQVNLIYSKELCSALSGPLAAAFLTQQKPE